MTDLPDPDWYLDHVLTFAEPGQTGLIKPTEVDLWRQWWAARADDLSTRWPALWAASAGFVLRSAAAGTAGVPRHVVRAAVRQRIWAAPERGTLALLGAVVTGEGDDRWLTARREHALAAASAAMLNPGHFVSGRSAAVLDGLPAVELPDRPELTVVRTASARRDHARAAALPTTGLADWFGIPLTPTARTVVDVARHSRTEGIVVADAALRCRLTTWVELRSALAEAAGWPGVRAACDIVELADPLAESPLESLTRLAIHDAGLPAPELQVPIPVPGRRFPYYVDLMWPERRLVLECDGRLKYRDEDAPWREKKRHVALERLDLRVERVLWDDVMRTWPVTEARLRRLLT